MAKELKAGDRAPLFSLPSETGEVVSLGDFTGKRPVVLYFYPKDNTPVCTKEACAFRDRFDEFRNIGGAEVIGISPDSVRSHKKFSLEHDLPFKLLSDENGTVRKLYGVPHTLGILPGRVTYVIDKKGIIRHVFSSRLNYRKHVEEAIETLRQLEKE